MAQGGDPDFVDNPSGKHPGERIPVLAPRSGYVGGIDGLAVGLGAVELGAGRRVAADRVDFVPGILIDKKVGSYVKEGESSPGLDYHGKDQSGSHHTTARGL